MLGILDTWQLWSPSHLMRRVDSLEKTLMLGGIGGRRRGRQRMRWLDGITDLMEDEMAGWHHWLDGRESEWTLGDDDGQGGLACCDSWGRKETDTTERLNWTELKASAWSQCLMVKCLSFVHPVCSAFHCAKNKEKLSIILKKQYPGMILICPLGYISWFTPRYFHVLCVNILYMYYQE